MSRIGREALLIKLTSVIAEDKQAQGTCQCIGTTRKASRGSCQTRQVVAQFSVVPLHRIGIGFALRNLISTPVIPQAVISIEGVAIVLLSLGRLVDHALNGGLSAFPNHFPAQITAGLTVYEREDVDPVFLWPIKVNNSSISAVLTSLGTGASGKLAALACTHNETVRW